jgi:hypothetical protein
MAAGLFWQQRWGFLTTLTVALSLVVFALFVQVAAPQAVTQVVLQAPDQAVWRSMVVAEAASSSPALQPAVSSGPVWLRSSAAQCELVVHGVSGDVLVVQRQFNVFNIRYRRAGVSTGAGELLLTQHHAPQGWTLEFGAAGVYLRQGRSAVVRLPLAAMQVASAHWTAPPEAQCWVRIGDAMGLVDNRVTTTPVLEPLWSDLFRALQARRQPVGASVGAQVQTYHAALPAIETATARLIDADQSGIVAAPWVDSDGRAALRIWPAVLRSPLGGMARPIDLPDWADAWLAVATGRPIASLPPPAPPILGVPGFSAWWHHTLHPVLPAQRWSTVLTTAAVRQALQQPLAQRPNLGGLLTMLDNDADRWLLLDLFRHTGLLTQAVATPPPDPKREPLRWLLRQSTTSEGAAWGPSQGRRGPTGDPRLDAVLTGDPEADLWTGPGPGLPPAEALACWLLARQQAGLSVDWSLLPLVPSAVLPLELLMPSSHGP